MTIQPAPNPDPHNTPQHAPPVADGKIVNHHTSTAPVIVAQKDRRALIGTAIWSWFLLWIPVALHAAAIAGQEVTVRGATLTIKRGIVSRRYTNIEMYRVKEIHARESAIASGAISIINTDGSKHSVGNLKDPNEFAYFLRSIIDHERTQRGVVSRENM